MFEKENEEKIKGSNIPLHEKIIDLDGKRKQYAAGGIHDAPQKGRKYRRL